MSQLVINHLILVLNNDTSNNYSKHETEKTKFFSFI